MTVTRICTIPNCGKPIKALGLCSPHYHRKRNGIPLEQKFMAPKGAGIAFILKHRSHQGCECLIWPYGRSKQGYGQVRMHSTYNAHRAMCIEAHGAPPSPQHHAAHTCGKGHEGCVNPAHLAWKTAAENQRDRIIHGTDNRGGKCKTSKLTESDVMLIRMKQKPQKELAAEYGVSVSAIDRAQRRETWAHLP